MCFLVITGPSAPILEYAMKDFSCIAYIPDKKYAIREKEGFYMKNTKKLLSLLLVFVMTLSMTNGFEAKAAETITVTLRMEQDQATLTKPIQLTMTQEDIKAYGDLALPTDTMTPLHVLAKYLIMEKGATEETLGNYILLSNGYLNGISIDGNGKEDYGSPSSDPKVTDADWMFAINDASPVNTDTGYGYMLNEYPMQDNDELVLYGVWGGDYVNGISPYYSTFEKREYQAQAKESLEIKLLGFDIFNDYGVKANRAIHDAHIIITDVNGKQLENNYITDENGTVSLTFDTAGTYTLSAYRMTADDAHFDISRPYATVTVAEAASPTPTIAPTPTATPVSTATPTVTPTTTPTVTPTTSPTATPTVMPTMTPNLSPSPSPVVSNNNKVTPAKVKNIKATVKKGKKSKKTISLCWQKVAKASGYKVYISKKKNKGFKKIADVNKPKAILKKKKGTYFVKICAYIKQPSNKTVTQGSFSKTKKIKVK